MITDQDTNISSIRTTDINTGMHEFVLALEVSDRLHLSKILRKIRTLKVSPLSQEYMIMR